MSKKIEWFDLDGTLWRCDAKWWIIDKTKPDVPLLRISQEEGYLYSSGFYLKDDHRIFYNGMEAWLSNDIFDKIQKIKKIPNTRLGISYREFNDISYLTKQAHNLTIMIKNIEHLSNHSDDVTIALLTARGNKKGHEVLLNKLKEELHNSKINIKIDKIYFANDIDTVRHNGSTPEKKAMIILEHIIGYRIQNNKFIEVKQEKYDYNVLYEDEIANINAVKDIKIFLQRFLNNTKKTMPHLSEEIINDINSRNIFIETNQVTTNTVNPFLTHKFKLEI